MVSLTPANLHDWMRGERVWRLESNPVARAISDRFQEEGRLEAFKRRYMRRNRIEIMFGRLQDWRRVGTRYDRCAKTFLSAVALAATVIFWL
jgi:transposase